MHILANRHLVESNIEAIWAFFSTPKNLNQLTPPSLQFEILSGRDEPIHNGQIISYRVRILPFIRYKWLTEIKHVDRLRSFVDEQRVGPYRFWYHKHTFIDHGGHVEIRDTVHYSLGFGIFGSFLNTLWVRPQLDYIFRYRNTQISSIFPCPGPSQK